MGMDTVIELDSKNGIKNKESTIDTDILIFLINSMFWIAVQGFFFELPRAWNIVRVIEGKIINTE